MGLSTHKFKESDFSLKKIADLSDTPSSDGMTAAELKARFDDIPKNMIALGNFNNLVDNLVSLNLDNIVGDIDDRYTKQAADDRIAEETNGLIESIEFTKENGQFKITTKGGKVTTIDTDIEKIPAKLELVAVGDKTYLRITNEDGSYTEADVTTLLNVYTFSDSETIGFTEDPKYQVTAKVNDSSIKKAHLSKDTTDYLEGLEKSAAASATASASSADESEKSAENSSDAAISSMSYAIGGTGTRTGEDTDNAKYYEGRCDYYSRYTYLWYTNTDKAKTAAETAQGKAEAAQAAAETAQDEAKTARAGAETAQTGALASETNAKASEESADASATKAQSYAVGNTSSRTGEETDNAKYYSEQAEASAKRAEDTISDLTKKVPINGYATTDTIAMTMETYGYRGLGKGDYENGQLLSVSADVRGKSITEKHISDEFVSNLLDSTAFTGEPTAPTPSTDDRSARIATTAFSLAAIEEAILAYIATIKAKYTMPDTLIEEVTWTPTVYNTAACGTFNCGTR